MALTEAQKRANNKYIAEHMTVLGCKVRKEYADKVREKAKEDRDQRQCNIEKGA